MRAGEAFLDDTVTVGEGLGDVLRLHDVGGVEIGDRARNLDRAVEPTPREAQLVDRSTERGLGLCGEPDPASGDRTGQMGVACHGEICPPRPLTVAGGLDPASDRSRGLSWVAPHELVLREPWHAQS